jgi:signal transduction histidine kinase
MKLKAKRNFVKYVSHEVRTPLNTVYMGLQLCIKSLQQRQQQQQQQQGSCLQEEIEENAMRRVTHSESATGDDEVMLLLVDINASCYIAINVLNELLLYDKMEDGNMQLEKTRVLVKEFLARCIHPFGVQVGKQATRDHIYVYDDCCCCRLLRSRSR